MGRLFLSCSPLHVLLAAGIGFGAWIAFDAVKTPTRAETARPSVAVTKESEGLPPHQNAVHISPSHPPLHAGMPRELVERILASATPEAAETTETVRGVSVRRVSYQVNGAANFGAPSSLGRWLRVTVDFDTRHAVQPVFQVSAVPFTPELPPQDESQID